MIKDGFCKWRVVAVLLIVVIVFLDLFKAPLPHQYYIKKRNDDSVPNATKSTAETQTVVNNSLTQTAFRSNLTSVVKENLTTPKIELEEFQISLQNNQECEQVISGNNLVDIATVMARQFFYQNVSTEEWKTVEKSWTDAIQACHGPVPEDLFAGRLTAENWLHSATKCANRTFFEQSKGNEFCLHWWNHHAAKDFESNSIENVVRILAKTARCGLHLEFPLTVPAPESLSKPTLREQGWMPQKTILIALTMGRKGASRGCNLLRTAFVQGWNVVFVEGYFARLHFKYLYTLKALEIALNNSAVPIEETFVVFADSFDVVSQKTPDQVVEAFLDQPHQIIWSAEEGCFPMASWPHSLGIKDIVCDQLYPLPHGLSLRKDRQFVNAGGWFGVASAARTMLLELSNKVNQATSWKRFGKKRIREPLEDKKDCYLYGTDQVLSNALFLKYQDRMGLDSESTFFASSPGNMLGTSMVLKDETATSGRLWCHTIPSSSEVLCPAFLHFNGGAQIDKLGTATEGLTNQSSCSKLGSLQIVNIDSGQTCQSSPGVTIGDCKWPCHDLHPSC